MLLLAFETSAKAASVALFEGEKLLGEQYQNTGLTHSQTLLLMAESVLSQCGKQAQQVEAVAVAEARKQIANYFKGFRGSAALRASINTALTYREVERAVSLVDESET